ncbi:MAG TPA: Spy/CpxP family protein refolding chaperone [Pyrinomonadaceae bacterium]|nr:Spy/CpxP family protein refolding chaperone [Pyrinomonadaceae bacterium]
MPLQWKKFWAPVAIALLTAASLAFSQNPQGPRPGSFGGGMGPGFPFGPMARDLNLTDAQKTQIKTITDSFRESEKALRDQLRTIREGQSDPLTSAFDEAAVRAAAEASAKIEVELEVSRARMMSQIGAVLTAEQKATLAEKQKQFSQGRPSGPPDRF